MYMSQEGLNRMKPGVSILITITLLHCFSLSFMFFGLIVSGHPLSLGGYLRLDVYIKS